MKQLILILAVALFSCSDSKTNTKETEEIETMESTSKEVTESAKELEQQTEKVEKALEDLDKEFKDTLQ